MKIKNSIYYKEKEKTKIAKEYGYETINDMLIDLSKTMGPVDLGEILQVSPYTIARHCNTLGIEFGRAEFTTKLMKLKIVNKLGYKTIDEFLVDNHKKYSATELGRILKITGACVLNHYRRLGLEPIKPGGNWRRHKKYIGEGKENVN